jgi:hypothetical protein
MICTGLGYSSASLLPCLDSCHFSLSVYEYFAVSSYARPQRDSIRDTEIAIMMKELEKEKREKELREAEKKLTSQKVFSVFYDCFTFVFSAFCFFFFCDNLS